MKSKVRLLVSVLALIVALLVAGAALVMTIGRNAASSGLPNPNGYGDLLKAAHAATGKIDDALDLDHGGLGALVATNAEALRLLRVGLSRRCAVATDVQVANFTSISRDLIGLKSLAMLLLAEGRLAEMENRPADAARSYVDAIDLGSQMSRGGLMINRLVGIACEGIGSIALVKLLPKLSCDQMRPIAMEIEKIDDNTVGWSEVLQNETHFVRAQTGNYPNPIKLLAALWQTRDARRAAEERHDLAAAHVRLLIAELALRSYRCDQGQGPQNLMQLVPKYVQHLPTDPFSNNPLIYRPTGTNWLLYSLGPDRVDDGGKPMDKTISSDDLVIFSPNKSGKVPKKGDLMYDSAW